MKVNRLLGTVLKGMRVHQRALVQLARKSLLGAASVLVALTVRPTLAQEVTLNGASCGQLKPPGQHGPFDYRKASAAERELVEGAHFGPQAEALVKPMLSKDRFAADFDYTLRAFPNHPRALIAMSRISLRERTDLPKGARWTVDCYFARGMAFQPNDHLVPLIYANHLRENKRPEEARRYLEKVEQALSDEPVHAMTYYNVGVQYLELGDLYKAQNLAAKASSLGHPDSRLQEEIQRKRK